MRNILFVRPITVFCLSLLFAVCHAGGGAVPPDEPFPESGEHASEAGKVADAEPPPPGATPVVALASLPDLAGIIPQLAAKRVVFVGETHNRYDHHLNQLEIIRELHARDPKLAIGMEFFQQPFQQHLDDYVEGTIDLRELLVRTEYYERWRLDFRHYAPIIEFAREHRIPVIALNAPSEITKQIGRGGLDSLSEKERAQIPAEIDRSDDDYRRRLKAIFAKHPKGKDSAFEHFVDVQLVWDETMAQRTAEYLTSNPAHRMVVLAGGGHFAYGSGIPARVQRRIDVDSAIVLNGVNGRIEAGIADYLLFPVQRELPAAGRLGILLKSDDSGVSVGELGKNSAAQEAGIRAGDVILALNDVAIAGNADVRIAMWDKRPGDTVTVKMRRERVLRTDQELSIDVTLR
ncbi:MAG: ChaN family lipoprotein [Pseudomonadota bacterium]|nr:MAG: ChaN family lipoprotein [Pseudomonadota bacterium]